MATAGPRNRKGDKGDAGLNGADGSTWFADEGTPEKSLGKKNDFYLNTKNADVYRKLTKEWIWIINLKGLPGKKGDKGDKGEKGITTVVRTGYMAGEPDPAEVIYITVEVDSNVTTNFTVTNQDFIRVTGPNPVTIEMPDALTYKKRLMIKNYSTAIVTIEDTGNTVNNEPNVQIRAREEVDDLGNTVDFIAEGGQFWVT